jgi:hypothetical protein
MSSRIRHTAIVQAPRVLLGLLFAIPGAIKILVPFATLAPHYGGGQAFMTAAYQSGYLFWLLGLTELVAGLLLCANRFVPLALIVLAPVTVNICLYHLVLELTPRGATMSTILVGLQLVVARHHRAAFRGVLAARGA